MTAGTRNTLAVTQCARWPGLVADAGGGRNEAFQEQIWVVKPAGFVSPVTLSDA